MSDSNELAGRDVGKLRFTVVLSLVAVQSVVEDIMEVCFNPSVIVSKRPEQKSGAFDQSLLSDFKPHLRCRF